MPNNKIGWGSYLNFEGPWFKGKCKFVCPTNPNDEDKLMAVLGATEGGCFDAINMYDRCILTVGVIQWCEAGMYGVSNMLGEVVKFGAESAIIAAGLKVTQLPGGQYRVLGRDGRPVLSQGQMRAEYFGGATGFKGQWTAAQKSVAMETADKFATVFQDPAAQLAQQHYTVQRLYTFVSGSARTYLWDGTEGATQSAVRAAAISFAANLPAVAMRHINAHAASTKHPKWSYDWTVELLKRWTIDSGIGIYPIRYNAIRPVIERLYGVNWPDFANQLLPGSVKSHTVLELQTALHDKGFEVGLLDGVMGAKTKDAIKRFQAARGLVADGIPGPKTYAELF